MGIVVENILSFLRPNARTLIPLWFPHGEHSGTKEYLIRKPNSEKRRLGSFSVDLDRGFGYDFSECKGYSMIDLYALYGNVSSSEAIRTLIQRLDIADRKLIAYKEPRHENPSLAQEASRPCIPDLPLEESTIRHPKLGTPNEIYCYRDDDCNVIGYTCRFIIHKRYGLDKVILPLTYAKHANSYEWVWRETGWNGVKPIYRQERIPQFPSQTVLITEGEKTCNSAARLFPELCCISWRGGAGSVRRVDWSKIAGRAIYIWPDNDSPGIQAAERIREVLPSAIVVKAPYWKARGWDLADAEEEGIAAETLLRYLYSSHL